jgi:hypothetical protein
MTQNFVWLPVRCSACGWRGQKIATFLTRTARVVCPQCGHTGDVPVPEPPAKQLPVRQWTPTGWRGGGAWASLTA